MVINLYVILIFAVVFAFAGGWYVQANQNKFGSGATGLWIFLGLLIGSGVGAFFNWVFTRKESYEYYIEDDDEDKKRQKTN